ncbi:galactoside 2-alpha-L-fucosyltransferase-like [Phalaenopsis equestris]|uniref:Fucosyltransferase n=1 Tax=Phalaenopsis equestris TaxID=78828 RepID=A0A1S6YG27_PHAEQ|nr:galactoside 2-alpha-L-fucosyltransferase-like [Phalaenopsis equestris]AQX44219.1 fucosyltransferase 1-like protein [Phalaenopsis equestris]
MDMKRIRRTQHSPTITPDLENDGGSYRSAAEKKPRGQMLRFAMMLIGFLVLLFLTAAISGFHPNLSFNQLRQFTERGHFELSASVENKFLEPHKSPEAKENKYLGGLLASGFEEQSCLSRQQFTSYRKPSSHSPSAYLLQRLRKYEQLHQKCGPNSDLYDRTVDQLKPDHVSFVTAECRYVVWISYSGLGNRMLSLTSAFLYALLTNRVLLVDRGADMTDLFCEPFPGTSWLLPLDFPLSQFKNFDINSPESYGNMLKNKVITNTAGGGASRSSPPSFVYLHLGHDYSDYDKLFFCEDDQNLLETIPWLMLRSDNYFVPSLFLIPTYQDELHQLFPKKDTVFHHLGRYLLHPTNPVWGLITRYYQSYLSKADERVGIQIRVFETESGPFQHVLDQVIGCAHKQKILPEVSQQKAIITTPHNRSKAILLTSLSSGYLEILRNMFWVHPATSGEIISFHQPSHEEHQQTGKQMHNMKAWAEMYLLSLTDVLVTSAWSTFGYVAQGLGGLKPWILVKSENRTVPEPPCLPAMSMEPCFHAPPFYDCKAKRGTDTGELVPHVRHCEDISWGLKLVDRDEW